MRKPVDNTHKSKNVTSLLTKRLVMSHWVNNFGRVVIGSKASRTRHGSEILTWFRMWLLLLLLLLLMVFV